MYKVLMLIGLSSVMFACVINLPKITPFKMENKVELKSINCNPFKMENKVKLKG